MKLPLNTKAVLFDMDGVLFNTEDLSHSVFESIAEHFGKSFDENDHRSIIGTENLYWTSYLIKKWNLPINQKQLSDLFWNELSKQLNSNLKLMPGVLACFSFLEKKNILKCLVTGSPRTYVEIFLNKFSMMDQFSTIITADDIKYHKPDPEPYLSAMRKIQVDATQCVVIEDSIVGVLAGSRAGCYVIAVPTIHTKSLDYSTADIEINALTEIET